MSDDAGPEAPAAVGAARARGAVVAILGAESTGKTTLAEGLARALGPRLRTVVVPETLREFCDRHGRTPLRTEQQGIADDHSARIAAAAADHDVVIADTTALQTAIYSDWVFGDRSLHAAAGAWQREQVRLTLLTALDLPWVADGLQRDGPQVREPIDRLLRGALDAAGVAYAVIGGAGEQRVAAALAACRRAGIGPSPDPALVPAIDPPAGRWQWICERCGDPDCERHLLPRSLS